MHTEYLWESSLLGSFKIFTLFHREDVHACVSFFICLSMLITCTFCLAPKPPFSDHRADPYTQSDTEKMGSIITPHPCTLSNSDILGDLSGLAVVDGTPILPSITPLGAKRTLTSCHNSYSQGQRSTHTVTLSHSAESMLHYHHIHSSVEFRHAFLCTPNHRQYMSLFKCLQLYSKLAFG